MATVDAKDSGIYCIEHIPSGRTYIGSAVNFAGRWRMHRSTLRRGKHHSPYMQKVWDKYGEEEFVFRIIEKCSRERLIEREQHHLDTCKPVFNHCRVAGSSAGREASQEARAKMSAAHKGKPGRQWTEETRQKQREVQTGKKRSPEVRARLRERFRDQPPPTVSEDGRRRIAEAARGNRHCVGRVLSEETKAKISAALTGRKGKPISDDHKARISQANRGRKHSPEAIAKMRAAASGRVPPPLAEEARKKISAARMGNSHWKGRKHTSEAKARMRAAWEARRARSRGLEWQQL